MAGRATAAKAAAAYEAFREPLQAALACLTRATLSGRSPFPLEREHPLELSEVPTPLGRDRGLFLRFAYRYRLAAVADEDRWEVRTTGYSYWLLDRHGHELLLYQWVPDGPSPVRTPHLHVRALAHPDLPDAIRARFAALGRAHLPTGHVTLAALLRVAIDDLGAEPLEPDPTRLAARLSAAEAVLRASFAWQSGRANPSDGLST